MSFQVEVKVKLKLQFNHDNESPNPNWGHAWKCICFEMALTPLSPSRVPRAGQNQYFHEIFLGVSFQGSTWGLPSWAGKRKKLMLSGLGIWNPLLKVSFVSTKTVYGTGWWMTISRLSGCMEEVHPAANKQELCHPLLNAFIAQFSKGLKKKNKNIFRAMSSESKARKITFHSLPRWVKFGNLYTVLLQFGRFTV